jgi:hypothetical protein
MSEKTKKAANLSPATFAMLQEICRWHANDNSMTLTMVHRVESELLATAELNRLGLVDATGSSWDYDRAWAVPTELAYALYELVDANDSPYFEPRDAYETRLVARTWTQLPLL